MGDNAFVTAASWLVQPLSVFLLLVTGAVAAASAGRRRLGRWLAAGAFAFLWICAMPVTSGAVRDVLEAQYPAHAAEEMPRADAIVVLGGALSGALPPKRPVFNLGPAAGRVWYAASLYRAGKAPVVVIAAGNRDEDAHLQIEADAIAQMLTTLGVPRRALRLDRASTNTRENAANTRGLVTALGAHRVLLVTSAVHMQRALATFRQSWNGLDIDIIPASADVSAGTGNVANWQSWAPSASALASFSSGFKEVIGMLALRLHAL